MKETVNEDTYQTLKEVAVTSYEKATLPMWKPDTGQKEEKKITKSPYNIMICTPCHSDVTMHYTQALLELQQLCIKKGIRITFTLLKSSLVTQGRNLCVSAFLDSNCTHMLFVDSDIYFRAESIIKMLSGGISVSDISNTIEVIKPKKTKWLRNLCPPKPKKKAPEGFGDPKYIGGDPGFFAGSKI